jgi:hypothetical protein
MATRKTGFGGAPALCPPTTATLPEALSVASLSGMRAISAVRRGRDYRQFPSVRHINGRYDQRQSIRNLIGETRPGSNGYLCRPVSAGLSVI